jgi:formylmethanofuran dehydrogenase subunit C
MTVVIDARVQARRRRRCGVDGDSARRRGSEKIGGGCVISGTVTMTCGRQMDGEEVGCCDDQRGEERRRLPWVSRWRRRTGLVRTSAPLKA